ncbi:unnamed protein product [Cuscuta campestris]|uniref:Apple domain-containing protein n=1 Tax=Cuscuta campestris TaxID=132261 RepID=A0A484NDZ2_9ASTE|nr:unnamed protein product [Cuscuta campestris]
MARGEWGVVRGRWKCSYKRTTIILCSINLAVALYVLHSLFNSLYIYPYNDSQTSFSYSPDQIRKMEESTRIRKASEPTELIKLVSHLKKEFLTEEKVVEVPKPLKLKITDEILSILRGLDDITNATLQREAVESWRTAKLKEANEVILGKASTTNLVPEEASVLARALHVNWDELLEEIGLWIPVEVINKERDDKPEGEEFENEIIAGKRLPPECHAELHTDYGGDAVRWGLTHHKESAYDCCMACLDQAKHAKPGDKICNIWVYCPSETGCYSPDIYEHKHQECWLKYSEKPRLSFKDRYSESYRNAHPKAPLIVPWMSGVVSVV